MNARRHRAAGDRAGFRFPVAGLITLFVFLVGISDSWAADCPVDRNGDLLPGWDITKSPTPGAFVVETAGSSCGTKQSTGYASNMFTSFEAMRAQYQSDSAAYYGPGGGGAAGGPYTIETSLVSVTYDATYAYSCLIRVRTDTTGGAVVTRGTNLRLAYQSVACEPPEEEETEDCADFAGKDSIGLADNKPLDWEPPETACLPWPGVSGGCEAFRKGQLNEGGTRCIPGTDLGCSPVSFSRNDNGDGTANFRWRNESTGQDCAVPDEDIEEVITEGEACNDAYCEGVDGYPGCGYFNGKYICPGDEDGNGDDECYSWDDGSRICAEGTPTPPVPDNGTPGEPAEPDDSIDHCTGPGVCDGTDYYDDETTDGSSRDPGSGDGSGSGPGSGNPVGPGSGGGLGGPGGSGTCSGEGCGEGEGGDGTASGGESCASPPECEGDPIQCAILNQEWRARCPDTDDFGDLDEMFGVTGTGPSGTDLIGSRSGVELAEAFDAEGFLGSGGGEACLDDIELDLDDLGNYTIPVSMWCTWMNLIGVLVMVGAYIGGIKLVVGGI